MDNKIYAKNWASSIIDVFEDFLNEKGIVIENEDREDYEGASNIYGFDYDYLLENVADLIKSMLKNTDIQVDTEHWES